MAKTRVYKVAETLGIEKDILVQKINELGLGFRVKNHMSALSEEEAGAVRDALKREQRRGAVEERAPGLLVRPRKRVRASVSAEAAAPAAPTDEPSPSVEETPEDEAAAARRARARRRAAVATTKGAVVRRPRTQAAGSEPVVDEPLEADDDEPEALDAASPEADEDPSPEEGRPSLRIRRGPRAAERPPVEETEARDEVTALEVDEAPVDDSPAAHDAVEPEPADAEVAVSDADALTSQRRGGLTIMRGERRAALSASLKPDQPEEGSDLADAQDEFDQAPRRGIQIRRGPRPTAAPVSAAEQGARQGGVQIVRKPATSAAEQPATAEASAQEVGEDGEVTPGNIKGYIDPAVIAARLAKDNKSFKPGPRPAAAAAATTDARRRGQRTTGRRSVSGTAALYGRGGHTGRRRGGRRPRGSRSKVTGERRQITQAAEHKRVLRIEDAITVGDLAQAMGVKASEIIKILMMQSGLMVTVNQAIDVETAEVVAQEFNFTIEDVSFREEEYLESELDAPEDLEPRAPVVTVMGHVDHGKTSLLDAIRHTNVTASEAGGITQHIGAHTVETESGGVIVFLDTPGHEAFTALRARGAKVTDIVILVVAADDGVMPQTVEAINHARAAGVPIIVAINKIDKPGANAQRVKAALTEYELISEDFGGDTIMVEVSALERIGIDSLLEMVLLQSEVLELQANPEKDARGVVLEAYKDVGRGTVATLIVQEGTLEEGDIVVSGSTYGRVRTMRDDRGLEIDFAGPAMPVEVTGLTEVPSAGEAFFVAEDERMAREFTTRIHERQRQTELALRRADPWAALRENKKLYLIVKGDVQGSVEALTQSLNKLSTDEVGIDVIHAAVGGITESDVQLAVASSALVIGFNTRPEARAAELAKREGVQFELHSVIYDVTDRVRDAMAGLLDPVIEEHNVGQAEVREIFSVPKIGTIAGCFVIDGRIIRNAKARVIRDSRVIYTSKINSLRRFKDDAKEVKAGFECGLSVENFNDIKVGDIIEVFELREVKATL